MAAMSRLVLFLITPAAAFPMFANDLTGFWKAADQPAWIEINTEGESATGVVRRNDVNADAVGRTLLKDVTADKASPEVWRGQIYAARLGEYRDAQITLINPSNMQIEVKVGIMSRAISWHRVAEVPSD
jgi:uncharacterized protein (DUF2147 family)